MVIQRVGGNEVRKYCFEKHEDRGWEGVKTVMDLAKGGFPPL
jgi:hypothetical protein